MAAPSENSYYTDTNSIPKEPDGRVTHLGRKAGEVAQRILTVGSLSRARRLRELLDDPSVPEMTSPRGFTTFTGTVLGVSVSIVATGMGAPMMDFLVREARAIVDAPLTIVRYGSCGGLTAQAMPGTVCLNTSGSLSVQRNHDAFARSPLRRCAASLMGPYVFSEVVLPDPNVAAAVTHSVRAALGDRATEGLNVSTCSFYSSQGRTDPNFDDRNGGVLPALLVQHPTAASM
jgi:uridine phosphorylase